MDLKIVKQLREKTGAGILECQKALNEAKGDLGKAVEILRKKGITKAGKRNSRETNAGIIKFFITENNKAGYMVEINSETDFVARNEQFQEFSEHILDFIKKQKPQSLDELKIRFKEELDNLSGIIGEHLEIGSYSVLKGDVVAGYTHMKGKIGVMVVLDYESDIDVHKRELNELAHDIALQITALNPGWILPEQVPKETVEKEKQIYQANIDKNKPLQVTEKIIEGKLKKFYTENCLLLQPFIKDDKLTIQNLIQQRIDKIGGNIQIKEFIRLST